MLFAAGFVTMIGPPLVTTIPEGLLSPVLLPAITRIGLAFPLAPAAKTKIACALSSATYRFWLESRARPTGLTSIVLPPEITVVGATFPLAEAGYSVMLCELRLPT
jgi:hypothetical protein